LHADGRVLLIEVESEGDSLAPYRASSRLWVDAGRQLAREEGSSSLEPPDADPVTLTFQAIHTTEATINVSEGNSGPRAPRTCYGADLATSVVLGCPGPTERSTTTTATGSYDGRETIVLTTEGTSRGSDEAHTFTRHLHLDATTYLPVAAVSDGTLNDVKPTFDRTTYEVSWLDAGQLAADHFDPSSIGYVPQDPEAGIRGVDDMQVYWLGREVDVPGIGTLVLRSSFEAPGRGAPYRYGLLYVRKETPFDPPFLNLQIFFRDMWDRSPAIARNAAFLGDTVVHFMDGGGGILTPDTIEALKRALVPYEG
jgi:hypothetical protein